VHLTNFSVNKKASNYVPNQNTNLDALNFDEPNNSSKWCLKQLRAEYQKMGVDFGEVFERIKDVIIKTLIAVEPHIVTNMKQTRHRNACFELYGFDIILDDTLKPWLLEVNVCPSLSSSSPLDKQIKTMLLCDVLHIIGLQVYDRKKHDKEQEKMNKQRLLGFDP
jgi:tubulin polyglutamylase TTLL4